VIEEVDVIAADQLLMITEEVMPDALGEYGMSPLSAAKQKLLDFLKHQTDPTPFNFLWGMMAKDMKQVDFVNMMSELAAIGKIKKLTLPSGPHVMATSQTNAKAAQADLKELAALLRIN
jgi:hypothetical protein